MLRVVVTSLQQEDLIQRSPRGKAVNPLLCYIRDMDETVTACVSIALQAEVNQCALSAQKLRLPSAAATTLWSTFHSLRSSKSIEELWTSGIIVHVPSRYCTESNLALQLILERMLKKLVADQVKSVGPYGHVAIPLTLYESNAVRYMAGFVAVKLLKQCRMQATHPLLKLKREY